MDLDRSTAAPLILIDGSGYIFRAFHALPPLTRPVDGIPVGAVYGFSAMLYKLLEEQKGARVLVIFDAGRTSFRTTLYPEYKAHRPPPPPELIPQFALIRESAAAFGCAIAELAGYEADDLIASYAREAETLGGDVQIYSSDKDLFQLIRPGIRLIDPMKNKEITDREVHEKFGVRPDQVGDLLALVGDTADNVPGAPGIGVKTAAQLLGEYETLEKLLHQAEQIKQAKRRETLVTCAEQIRLSRRLIELDTNAPLPLPLTAITTPEPDPEALQAWLLQQGFKTLSTRIASKSGIKVSTPPPSFSLGDLNAKLNTADQLKNSQHHAPFGTYMLIQDEAVLQDWIEKAHAQAVIAIDTETTSLIPAKADLVGISLALSPGEACYIPLAHRDTQALLGHSEIEQIDKQRALALLKPLLEDHAVLKIGQNVKFDWQMFAQHDIYLYPYDDTMLLSSVLDNGLHGHGMDTLSSLFLDHTPILFSDVCGTGKNQITFDQVPLDKACAYAAEDADVTLRLWHCLKPRLISEKQTTLYEVIERPLPAVVGAMELDGVRIDPDILRVLSQEFSQKMLVLETDIYALAKTTFNLASPKQLGEVLFDNLQLPGGIRSKNGAWVTDADVLDTLAAQGYEIAQKILDWRQYHKLRSTYTESLQQQINPRSGRIHTSFALAATVTGRFSSTDPNLQNIPIRSEEGRLIRRAFIAEEGNVLLSADYSQIELRLLAHVADIPALKEAFLNNEDIHRRTASEVFGVPHDQVSSDLRRRAKAINFGIIYGISAFGLARNLGIAQSEASQFIKIYFERFPQLRDYMEAMKSMAREKGFVTTIFGRRCYLTGMNDKNNARRSFAERQAINAPLQGSAADVIKKAMGKIPAALLQDRLSARMLLQVHDELVFEVPTDEAEKTARIVKTIMEGTVQLSVPLIVEVGSGKNWADAH